MNECCRKSVLTALKFLLENPVLRPPLTRGRGYMFVTEKQQAVRNAIHKQIAALGKGDTAVE